LSSTFDSACYLELSRVYTTTTNELVSKGALDAQNRDSLRAKTPLTPGQKYWFQIPLWTKDYTFLAGHRIGVVLVGTYRQYPSLPKTSPIPTFELNVNESKVSLPVVGGRDALGF
jgi:X-Pro dipeptidyl-peptidase